MRDVNAPSYSFPTPRESGGTDRGGAEVRSGRCILVLLSAWALITPALAQTYPERAIKIIVPQPPGAGSIRWPASWLIGYRRCSASRS